MVIRSSYLHNGNSYIGKIASSRWISSRDIPGQLGQHHDCWCPGSLHCQGISSHGLWKIKREIFVLHEGGFQLPVPFIVERGYKIQMYIFMPSKWLSMLRVKSHSRSYASEQKQRQNADQTWNSQKKTPCSLPFQVSYGHLSYCEYILMA